jgi:hypothetical protein
MLARDTRYCSFELGGMLNTISAVMLTLDKRIFTEAIETERDGLCKSADVCWYSLDKDAMYFCVFQLGVVFRPH